MTENQFYIWPRDGEPRQFVPPHDPVADDLSNPVDLRYFAHILKHVNTLLGPRGITFLITWNVGHFDSRFDDAVVLLVGDEQYQIPAYAARTRAIFKTGGVHAELFRSMKHLPLHIAWRLALRQLRNDVKSIQRRFRRAPGTMPPIFPIPLGYFRLVEVPFTPFSQRTTDVFFAGGLASAGKFTLRASVAARADLAVAFTRLNAALPEAKMEFSLNPTGHKYDPASYSQMLMQSKIVPCPRGNIDDTFRMLEAAKSGCIVISEKLPDRWYHDRSPAIQLRSWDLLLPTVRALLAEPQRMESLHVQTLKWWTDYLSEQAVAKYIVENIAPGRDPASTAEL